MPRRSDPQLEARILAAAQKLWARGGEDALSMRKLARAAGTNTPAVYRRFRHRNEILRALVSRAQEELASVVRPCRSSVQVADAVLAFALQRRREYTLVTSGLLGRLHPERPNFELMKRKIAGWLGGAPEDYVDLLLAEWALVHGAATLLISKTLPPSHEKRLRRALRSGIRLLESNAIKLRRSG